ncbi:MAG TPA: carboxypeptidase regulatory-like domain-containing protein [Gammaproteobacteria bacterium]|nr:carboxypeptidase regulatory-like domain-containing protein [Gammaproteobacteria bacterium]
MATKRKPNYSLYGKISDRSGEPISGLSVRAFDQDPKSPNDPLGEATTSEEGRYLIRFEEKDFMVGGVESGGPDVFIRVYDGEELLGESDVRRNAKNRIIIDLIVDYIEMTTNEPARSVSGIITDANDDHLEGLIVRAFDRDLRSEQFLGESRTDENGGYSIQYYSKQFRKREKLAADLVIKVYKAKNKAAAESAILFNAPFSANIDLTVPVSAFQPPSLFEKIKKTLKPLLDDVVFSDLNENEKHQDISFLSGETGFDKDTIARFVLAHRLADEAIQPEFWFVLLGGSFYQFRPNKTLDDQYSVMVDSLNSVSELQVRKALARGFKQIEIPEKLKKKESVMDKGISGVFCIALYS